MKSAISAEWYKVWHDKLAWCALVLVMAFGLYNAGFDHVVFNSYKNLELFVMPTLGWLEFAFVTVLLTGYVIGLDFSKRTIHNVLSVGVRKRDYYFSRLIVQFVLETILFALGILVHTAVRLVAPKGDGLFILPSFWTKFAFFMLIALLQLWAYTAMFQMICFLVKNQLVTMIVGMIVVFLEALIRQLASIYDISGVVNILNFSPARVLKNSFQYAIYDRFFEFDFWKYGLSALGIIIITSAVGYGCFRYRKEI